MLLSYFCFFTSCSSKIFCFSTKNNYWNSNRCKNEIFTNVTQSFNFTRIISDYTNESDTSISFYVDFETEIQIPLKIFNDKQFNLFIDYKNTVKLDVSGMNNAEINVQPNGYTNENKNYKIILYGSQTKVGFSSICAQSIILASESKNLRFYSLTLVNSEILIPSITVNNFNYTNRMPGGKAIFSHKNNFIEISNSNIYIIGKNPLSIQAPYITVFNEATESSLLFNFLLSNTIIFKGNDFKAENVMNFYGCQILNVSVGFLYINQFTSTSYSRNLVINADKALKIKGPFQLITTYTVEFNTTNKVTSRISIEIDNLNFSKGYVNIFSSWIDLVINTFNYTSDSKNKFPIKACIGYGGSSTVTIINCINLDEFYGTVYIEFDFTGFQTDKTLKELMKKEWNPILIKSFNGIVDYDLAMNDIYFVRNNVYGFQNDGYNLLNCRFNKNNMFAFYLSCSSFSTIPLLLCLTDSSSCYDGMPINDVSQISEMIPDDQKVVNLTILLSNVNLDFSSIQKQISILTIESDSSTHYVNSIKTNSNIDRLILKNTQFAEGTFQFNSNEVTFYKCQSSSSTSKLFFVFNKENCLINTDFDSLLNLETLIENTLPLIHVESTAYHFTALNITDDYFNLSCSSYKGYINISRKNIPKIVFNIDYNSVENAKPFSVYFSETKIDFIKMKFKPYNIKTDIQKMTVALYNLDKIISANSFNIDLENFGKTNSIDLNGFTWKDFLSINSKEYQILNEGYHSDNLFCICKDELCDEFCDEKMNRLNYNDDFTVINQRLKEGITLIQVVGNNDNENIPVIPIESVDNNLKIIGTGQNPRIQIDCLSQSINADQKMITFSNININFHSNTNNVYFGKITFLDDCVIDSSSSSTLALEIDELTCYESHLVFKSILVQKVFDLIDSPSYSGSSTHISFGSMAEVYLKIPTEITFIGSKLVFNDLEFDLTNSIPFLTVSISTLTITGVDGNIEPLASNITINGYMRDLKFKGTWDDIDYTRFFFVSDYLANSFLYFESLIVPFYIQIYEQNIVLLSNDIKLRGKITSYLNNKKISIRTDLTGNINFFINEIDVIDSIDISFDSPNINVIVDKLNSSDSIIKLTYMIDQYFHDTIKIVEKFDSAVFQYNVNFYGFEGSLFDSDVVEFLKNNFTVLTVHDENIITPSDMLFSNNYINGFQGKNFKFTAIGNKLYFHLAENPEIYLRIGSMQPGKNELIIQYEDLSSLEKYIPVPNAIVNILITCDITDLFFDFENINIHTLNCFGENYTVFFKLGTSICNLNAESLIINVPENDKFEIQNINLTKSSRFNNISINSEKIKLASFDHKSFMLSNVTSFSNELNLIITDSYSLLTINFTSFGIKLIYNETSIHEINASKFPNTNIIIETKDSPLFNLEEGVIDIKHFKSFVLNSENIYLGSNWDKLSSNTHFTINNSLMHSSQTDSFPIDSWDFLYQNPITLSNKLNPNKITQTFNISNKNIIIEFQQTNEYNFSNITFDDVIMSDHSSITFSEHFSKFKIIIKKITIQNGTSAIYNIDNNVLIQDEITLKKGSILNGNFSISKELKVLNFEWDLNESPFLNSSIIQDIIPDVINIIYKGKPIEGREKEFDEFLSNGFLIIKNFGYSEILNRIHFTSLDDNIKEFRDGDELILKCKFVFNQSIKVFSTKYFSPDDNEDEETLPTENPTTEIFIPNKPTVDYFESSSSNIEFTDKGFIDGDIFVSTENNNNENNALFIKSNKNEIFISTNPDSKPNKRLFVSPQEKDVSISIIGPENDNDDYGTGSFGVHANSNDPILKIPHSKIPLNLFNDEMSEIEFQFNKENLDETNITISLQKLTISNGDLTINLPKNVNHIEFEEIETFLNGNVKSIQNKMNSIEIKVSSLKLNSGSKIKMANMNFNNTINIESNSQIEIEEKVKFNEKTSIEISDTSFIEFGHSEIEGIADKIKIIQTDSNKKMLEKRSLLICGFNFDCISWIDKIIESNQFLNCSKIENDENCLIVKNNMLESPSNDPVKKKMSTTIIAVIVVVVVVVVAIIISIIFIIWKKKHKVSEKEEDSNDKFISDYI